MNESIDLEDELDAPQEEINSQLRYISREVSDARKAGDIDKLYDLQAALSKFS